MWGFERAGVEERESPTYLHRSCLSKPGRDSSRDQPSPDLHAVGSGPGPQVPKHKPLV